MAGEADVAAIDEVTFTALSRFEPELTGQLQVLAKSAPAATPAFVTAAATSIEVVMQLRVALERAVANAPEKLGITGIIASGVRLRDRVLAQDAAAFAAGYQALA
jgi:ABC-type phosphate/phosphonate transport system substrate-binding protein